MKGGPIAEAFSGVAFVVTLGVFGWVVFKLTLLLMAANGWAQ